MLKKIALIHLFPFLLASVLVGGLIFVTYNISKLDGGVAVIEIEGAPPKIKGRYGNLLSGNQAELDFISSIENESQVTLLGSSEFSESPLCSYNFLPDSLGIPALGVGHAYHQEFSMMCELLAVDEYIENSKICIVLSPGWFHTEGTNISSFVEFVRPNFLNRIVNDSTIETEYKYAIGKYIDAHYNEIDGVSNSMDYLRDEYLIQNTIFHVTPSLRQNLKRLYSVSYKLQDVSYKSQLGSLKPRDWTVDRKKFLINFQNEFVSKITTNTIFVYDEYYEKYLVDENGNQKVGTIGNLDLESNQELKDFKLLVKYLVSRSTNCSFIIQPQNPYYYEGLEKNKKLVDTLTQVLDENNIPYLNMYVSEKKDYETGTLKDIMHLGDYGWMKINYFLDSLYNEH